MGKSILVIDTPENCYDCGVRKGYMCGGISGVCGIGKKLEFNLKKPDWCPLKEIPKERNHERFSDENPMKTWESGWNACLENILGESD